MIQSQVQQKGKITFPDFNAEKHYMIPFLQKKGLPNNLKHWQPTVDQMLEGISTDLPIYMMVDQQAVKQGEFHRRPGLHVDGYWNTEIGKHGHIMKAHSPRHGPIPVPGHGPTHLYRSSGKEALLLAANIGACTAFVGEYNRDFLSDWRGGDCSDIDVSSLMPVYMEDGMCYEGDVLTLHESTPMPFDCLRTLVRLNVPM